MIRGEEEGEGAFPATVALSGIENGMQLSRRSRVIIMLLLLTESRCRRRRLQMVADKVASWGVIDRSQGNWVGNMSEFRVTKCRDKMMVIKVGERECHSGVSYRRQ